jgi:hypothetical protein
MSSQMQTWGRQSQLCARLGEPAHTALGPRKESPGSAWVSVQDQLPPLVTATMFATVATALTAHMHEAVRRGWVLPRQLYPRDYVPGAAMLHQAAGTGVGTNGSGSIDIQGMWPYWLEGHKPEVVRNDCSMQVGPRFTPSDARREEGS